MPTITEFLEARIAENERAVAVASEYGVTKMFGSMSATAIVIQEDGTRLWTTDQLLAECAAKRAIIDGWEDPAASQTYGSEVDDGYILAIDRAVRALAAVYSDHPDYQQGWAQ
jgi:hypothetical protein